MAAECYWRSFIFVEPILQRLVAGIGPKALALKEASILIRAGSSCKYESYDWKLMICAGGHKDRDTCKVNNKKALYDFIDVLDWHKGLNVCNTDLENMV